MSRSRQAIRSISITKNTFKPPFVPLVAETGFAGAIGNTPLLKLPRISASVGRNIYAKAEYMNPGGLIKDRAALYVVKDAEEKGLIGPGGTVVEGTAGNTGIGLAHICRARGYHCVIYMPNTQSQAKMDTLRLLGAEVHPVPVVPFSDPMNFNHQAKRHAEQMDNAVWTDQFDNLANRQAHMETTGPEIWAQLDGKVDAFTCATGTGGTFAGITHYLKNISNGNTMCVLADPPGAAIYSFIKTGELKLEGLSFTEGIGQGRITNNLGADLDLVDDAIQVPDEDSIVMAYRLLDEEGLYIGGTGGLNVAAAVKVAQDLPEGLNVVTLLPDSAHKYVHKMFSKLFLKDKGLYDAIPDHLKKYAILD